MKHHSPAFLRALIERARARGVLVVADEVAVGFGRLGTMFAMEQVGVSPDLLCLAKGIAAGYLPLAATLTTERVYEAFLADPAAYRQLFHGHTFTGNPLACAVALESLKVFDRDDVLGRVAALERVFAEALGPVRRSPFVHAVRHKGVMIGIDVGRPDGSRFPAEARVGHRVAMATRPRGVVVRPLGDTVVVNPPLSFGDDDARTTIRAVAEAIDEVGSQQMASDAPR